MCFPFKDRDWLTFVRDLMAPSLISVCELYYSLNNHNIANFMLQVSRVHYFHTAALLVGVSPISCTL